MRSPQSVVAFPAILQHGSHGSSQRPALPGTASDMPNIVSNPEPSGAEAACAPLYTHNSFPDSDSVVMTPVGEADLYTAPALRQALCETVDSGRSRIIVDLDRLTFMDASTLGALVTARLRACTVGGTLQVRCTTRLGRRLLSITGLESMLVPQVDLGPI